MFLSLVWSGSFPTIFLYSAAFFRGKSQNANKVLRFSSLRSPLDRQRRELVVELELGGCRHGVNRIAHQAVELEAIIVCYGNGILMRIDLKPVRYPCIE